MEREPLEDALATLGELLAERSQPVGLLVVGGSSLLLLGKFTSQLRWRLTVDLICFKLYALVDQGPRSKHMPDLLAMNPTPAELIEAARWARTHDPSEGFLSELRGALAHLGVEVDDDSL